MCVAELNCEFESRKDYFTVGYKGRGLLVKFSCSTGKIRIDTECTYST